MTHRLLLLAAVLLLAVGFPGVAPAQEAANSQTRYIEELKQRNIDYGPGCDGIGVTIPHEVNMPADITSDWASSHSACVPGLRLIMSCLGDIVEGDLIIGCTLQVADGQAEVTLSCDQLTLIAPDERLPPDPTFSAILSRGSAGRSRSCAEATELAPGAAVAAAYVVPEAASAADLAITIYLDGSEVPAFLIPAGQLERAPAADA